MNIFNLKSWTCAAAFGLLSAATGHAATVSAAATANLDIAFSFAEEEEIVAGTIFGLTDNAETMPSQIVVTTSPIGMFTIAGSDLMGDGIAVSAGQITDSFVFHVGKDASGRNEYSFDLGASGGTFSYFIGHDRIEETLGPLPLEFAVISAVPLPAGGMLLISGLMGIFWLRKIRLAYERLSSAVCLTFLAATPWFVRGPFSLFRSIAGKKKSTLAKTKLWVAAAVTLATSSPIAAAPINLDFSFDSVSGTFYGLDDAVAGSQAATSYDLYGVLGDYSGIDTGAAGQNEFSFNLASGALATVAFSDRPSASANAGGSVLEAVAFWTFGASNAFFGSATESKFFEGIKLPNVSIRSASFSSTPVAAVPLPSGAVLLLSGIAGVAGLRHRRKPVA